MKIPLDITEMRLRITCLETAARFIAEAGGDSEDVLYTANLFRDFVTGQWVPADADTADE